MLQARNIHNTYCPVCGNKDFKLVSLVITVQGIRSNQKFDGYECCGCSVRFTDPEKFFKSKIPLDFSNS